ncbi:MAG: prephenate dehydratase [Candidatus Dadabacteria bacterium]|nr:prephenate dehydratase [Candidatus Dadabacteria bacterium]NIS07952.1 prephenate dehydratase [Candidatus Dadabacteria bacterium]NIV43045.1 prephenate dehydratase [Candidatus Dadabacteria bacterium]NIX14908.1 prephenate dehydratase [Candidatus Dadabacteria bacterium]NIY21536.1 prephenate dehydratase [Candidatus Dadabacteria bacterium]
MSPNNKLQTLREQIDEIDHELLDLLNLRAGIALKVSEFKQKNAIDVYDPARENQVLQKIKSLNKGPLDSDLVKSVFKEIISVCRSIQRPIALTVLGPPGSYSHQVATKILGTTVDIDPVPTIDDVFVDLEKRKNLFGVVPVENSAEGSIGNVLDRFIDTDLKICSEHYERISHSLLSVTGKIDDVKTVASHPQALGQCRKWLSKRLKNVDYKETSSTAKAAQLASENKHIAAIAGKFNASIYGLEVVESNIEDYPNNTTRFFLIGYQDNSPSGNDKTSIVFSLKDEPGALSSVLMPFDKQNINLTKIESRPTRKKSWEYVFFVDFDGHVSEKPVQKILDTVKKSCVFLKILGSYPKGKI